MMKSTNVIYRMNQTWDELSKQIISFLSQNGQINVLPNIMPIYLVSSKPLPVTKEVRELL